MSNTSTASDLARPLRRSTRLNAVVPITVMGVDSYRGPYREDVSTVSVSCHGCRYESKHDVLTNSWVMLELNGKDHGTETVSARGLVKWVKRPPETAGTYETAIEFEDPGNIWGIDAPPQDWLTFCESRLQQPTPAKSKPFAVSKSEPVAKPPAPEKSGDGAGIASAAAKTAPSPPPAPALNRPVRQLVGDFHQQMEQILFEAAGAAVRERATSTLDEVRHGLREEAKAVLTELASSPTGPWIDQSLKQLNRVTQESARTLHAAWTKRLDSDIRRALDRVEERSKELDHLAQSLSANALDRLQRGLESSREEGVDRIVFRLKEQSAPVIDHAKETMAGLAKQREELETVLDQALAKATGKIEEVCAGFEKQFEMIIRERLDTAREELQGAIQWAANSALNNFSSSAQHHAAEAEARLQRALEPLEVAIADMKEKATETSHQFSRELENQSRTHLELVSSAISEVAKGIGKLPKE
jgi:hypothetical protein